MVPGQVYVFEGTEELSDGGTNDFVVFKVKGLGLKHFQNDEAT